MDSGVSLVLKDGNQSYLHSTHAATDAGVQLLNPHTIEHQKLRSDHIPYGDDGEPRRVLSAVRWIDARRPRGPVASAEDVGADDEEFISVNV